MEIVLIIFLVIIFTPVFCGIKDAIQETRFQSKMKSGDDISADDFYKKIKRDRRYEQTF